MLHPEYDDSGAVGSNSWKLLFLLIAAIKYLVCQPSNCVLSKKDISAHSVQVDMCQGANWAELEHELTEFIHLQVARELYRDYYTGFIF